MSNSEIVEIIELTTKLLELHAENEFKIKNYSIAAYNLDKVTQELALLTVAELAGLQGVGKSMAVKIEEIVKTGQLTELNELIVKTPEGVIEMFKIKGIGSKKIRLIWTELNITDTRELLLACQNGEVAKLKGFGEKIQAAIIESILFNQLNASKLRMDKAEVFANEILIKLKGYFDEDIEIVGQIPRKSQVVDLIQFLIKSDFPIQIQSKLQNLDFLVQTIADSSPFIWRGCVVGSHIPIEIIASKPIDFEQNKLIYNATEVHLAFNFGGSTLLSKTKSLKFENDFEFYQQIGLPFIIPSRREGVGEFEWFKHYNIDDLIQTEDLKGVLHNHSTYSDGQHTLKLMADYCLSNGYEYFGIADHSKSATYAKGLSEEKVFEQFKEIDEINKSYQNFRILKGIEADILGDGNLDYDADVLKHFDYVVASVHSNLKMNEEKAMSRVIKAIENPYTTILGHPTGRVLLTREGYPINHKKVIDACAANNVVIELNASPYRLDIDWRWIPYCLEKGVMISINPDAHEMKGIHDMNYGVAIAQKGGLVSNMTLNAKSLDEILVFLSKKSAIV